MIEYIVIQIIQGKLEYSEIVSLYSDRKEEIDELLYEKGWGQLVKNK